MKKLMLAAAIVCAAAMSQASTVTWGLTGGTLDAVKFADATAYLFQTTSLTRPTLTADNVDAWYKDNKGSFASAAFRTLDVTGGAVSDTELIDTKIGMKSYWLLVVADDEKNIALSTSTKAGNIQTGTTNVGLTWTAGTQTSTFTLASVPEPTSALLMLIGVAGLALKRRRA